MSGGPGTDPARPAADVEPRGSTAPGAAPAESTASSAAPPESTASSPAPAESSASRAARPESTPSSTALPEANATGGRSRSEWPLYEVFIRARSGLEHKHVGSVHAVDAHMAIEHARDVYTRREEGISIWVVRSADIVASDPADADALFTPARDKIYRHPTFYEVPAEVKNL